MRAAAQIYAPQDQIQHGPAARRDWLLENAGGGELVALSTHASFDMERPERSFFVLAHPSGETAAAGRRPKSRREAVQSECEKLALGRSVARGVGAEARGAGGRRRL